MTSLEQTNISQEAEQIKFVAKDFDYNLSDQEKQEAAIKLDALIKSTLKRFPDQVNDWSGLDANKGMDECSILLYVPQEDGSYLSIRVESELSTDNTRSRKIIVHEMTPDGDRKYHRYYIEDGQALRFDKDLSKSERTPGINHQPVGVDEIDKLAELLEAAVPYAQSTNRLCF